MFEKANMRTAHFAHDREMDRVLSGPAFAVDKMACSVGAQVLKDIRTEPVRFEATRSIGDELLYRVSLAAICHQINWDFLSERLAGAVDSGRLNVSSLCDITGRDLEDILEGYPRPDRIRAKERAALLRDFSRKLVAIYSGDILKFVRTSEERLRGPGGFLQRLDYFTAFSDDPLRKKSNVLVHEVVRDNVIRFLDERTIEPAIDYHIMRLYLRTGRVVPMHKHTHELLKRDSMPRPRLVTLLRMAASEALQLTSLYADLSIPEVNGLEWQLGREICNRIDPKCEEVPDSVRQMFKLADGCCPNRNYCRAFSDSEWRMLKEPDHNKSFY